MVYVPWGLAVREESLAQLAAWAGRNASARCRGSQRIETCQEGDIPAKEEPG